MLSDDELAFGDYGPGRYAWMFAGLRALAPPMRARGAQGLWVWEAPSDWERWERAVGQGARGGSDG